MDQKLQDLVDRLQKAHQERLVSVILYGSAASGDHHGEFSDLNVLCVLTRVTPAELGASEPVFKWWRDGNPTPLLLSEEEVRTSTDCFPIEFHDMQERRQVLFGKDVIESEALISNIVDAGMQQGWLKRTRRTPGKKGTEVLYIVQAAPPAAGGAGPACQPAPPADQMEPPPLKAIPASDEVTAGGGAGPAASAIPEPPPVSAEANPQEARRKFPN